MHQWDKKIHIQSVHEGMKYKCKLCDKEFACSSGRLKHVKSVHEGVRYKCSLCNYQATTKRSLKQHQISVHFKQIGANLLKVKDEYEIKSEVGTVTARPVTKTIVEHIASNYDIKVEDDIEI